MEKQYETLEPSFGISKKLIIAVVGVLLVLAVVLPFFFGFNGESTVTVIQRPWGTFSVKEDHGVYFTWGGKVTVYEKKMIYWFDANDGAIPVRFNDGYVGQVYGKVMFRMPKSEDAIIRVHHTFRSQEQIVDYLCIPVTVSIIQFTAVLMSSEEAKKPSGKEKFAQQVHDQLVNGPYALQKDIVRDPTGSIIMRPIIMRDSDGKLLRDKNRFYDHGISVTQTEIKLTCVE